MLKSLSGFVQICYIFLSRIRLASGQSSIGVVQQFREGPVLYPVPCPAQLIESWFPLASSGTDRNVVTLQD